MQLGSVTLHGYADMPDPFVGLVASAVNGWRGLPGARGEGDLIPGGQGSYQSTKVLREPRSIEVRGAAVARSEHEAVAMIDALEFAVGSAPVDMWVHDSQGAWRRRVEVESVQVVGAYNRDRIRFVVDAIAADPRRYRETEQLGPVRLARKDGGLVLPSEFPWSFGSMSGGYLDIQNSGTVPMFPVLVASGGFTSVRISDLHSGRNLEFGAVAPGDSVRFDSRSKRAHVGNVDVTRDITRRGWIEIPPRSTHRITFKVAGAVGSPQLSASFQIGAW